MKKITFLIILAIAGSFLFSGCSKDKDGPKGSHKVVFKLVGSNNVLISSIVYSNENGDPTSVTGVDSQNWTSEELTIPNSVHAITINGGASTVDGEDGKLTVQIIVDGKVEKENSSTGPILSVQSVYTF